MGFSTNDIEDVFYNVAKGKCQCCGKKLVFKNRQSGDRGAWHAHHVKPLKSGIDNSKENMSILCIGGDNCHLNCAHGGFTQEIRIPVAWGSTFKRTVVNGSIVKERIINHKKRRCWRKRPNGEQCENTIDSSKNSCYCNTHKP